MKLIDLMNAPWAILPEKLTEIKDIYATHLRGDKIDLKGIEARIGRPLNNRSQEIEVRDGVAIIQIEGVLAPKMNLMNDISGGTSTQMVGNQIKQALADETIKAIILEIDSPGGAVTGTMELVDQIFNARGQKPIVTLAQGTMASAAVWIGTAADRVYIASRTSNVGSIGVVAKHVDVSGAEEKQGIKTTEISAGKFKRIASEFEPLSKEGREHIQERVDEIYSIFVESIARNRGVSVGTVLKDMADGRLFIGDKAIKAGLVDGVSTLDALVKQLSNSGGESVGDNVISTFEEGNHNMEKDKTPLTAELVAKEFPSVYDEIVAKEKEKIYTEGREAGVKAGIEAENARVQDVMAQSIPGHEKMVNELAFDGVTSGPEAAVKVLQADKGRREAKLEATEKDAAKVVEQAEDVIGQEDFSNLPVAQRCKKEFDSSADLQGEFGDVETYIAFEEANAAGKVRVLQSK